MLKPEAHRASFFGATGLKPGRFAAWKEASRKPEGIEPMVQGAAGETGGWQPGRAIEPLMLAQGCADRGMAIEAAAKAEGLGFTPV